MTGARTHARVSIVQARPERVLAQALAQTAELTRQAAAGGAQLVAFPETWIPGYPAWLDVCRDAGLWNSDAVKSAFADHAANAVDVTGAEGAALAKIAADSRVVLVVGVVERVPHGPGRGTLYNAMLTYGPEGGLLNHHRKLVPTYTERLVWGPGDGAGLRAVETPAGRVGGLVCWEHWMPLARQALHDSGEDIHVAAWPTVHEMHQVASRHYAFEGRCFVLAAGSLARGADLPAQLVAHPERVASPESFTVRGGSAIYAPDGSCIADPVYEAETILTADLDLQMIRREAMTLDVSGHYARPDVLQLTIEAGRRGARG